MPNAAAPDRAGRPAPTVNPSIVAAVVRTILALGAGGILNDGLATEDELKAIVGGLLGAIVAGWSIYQKVRSRQTSSPSAPPATPGSTVGLLLAAGISLAILCSGSMGCASGPDKAQRCSTYAALYAAYLQNSALGTRPISKDEAMAASAAAAFLTAYCGWLTPKNLPATDANGVPLVLPPDHPTY